MKAQFDLTSTFSLKGDWFLPDSPDKRLSGEVSYSPEKGVYLELIGAFSKNPLDPDDNNYTTILGIVEGSRKISLFECLHVGRTTVSFVCGSETAKPVTTYSVNLMLDGWHYDSCDDICVKTVYIQFDGLAEWLQVSGFGLDAVKMDEKTIDVHYQRPEPINFEFSKGVKASFDFCTSSISQPAFRTSFEMQQVARLKIQREAELTLDDILRVAYKFLAFLMLGLNGETFVKSITCFFYPNNTELMPDETLDRRRVDFFYQQHLTVKENKWDFYSMTFTYPAVKDKFQQLITKWENDFSDFEPAINLLVEQICEKNTFSINDFLNLAQAAETLHDRIKPGEKKMPDGEYKSLKEKILNVIPEIYKGFVQGLLQFGNNASLRQRLIDLVEMCPGKICELFIPDKDAFINEVLDSRNYYTHYTISGKKNVKQGRDLMLLTKRIQILLIINILLHLGMSDALLIRLYANQKYQLQWLLES